MKRYLHPRHYFTAAYWRSIRETLRETVAMTNNTLDHGGSTREALAKVRPIVAEHTRRLTMGTEYTDIRWPHGLRCCECNHLFREGDRFSERLDSFVGDSPVVLIVCVRCALGDAA